MCELLATLLINGGGKIWTLIETLVDISMTWRAKDYPISCQELTASNKRFSTNMVRR